MAARYQNICVVGDDAQSIYAFRGANIQNILNFKRDYPDVRLFKLEQNYRSTGTILDAANAVIANNKGRKGKKLWTDRKDGANIKLKLCDEQLAIPLIGHTESLNVAAAAAIMLFEVVRQRIGDAE